jgi:hypothetical protein
MIKFFHFFRVREAEESMIKEPAAPQLLTSPQKKEREVADCSVVLKLQSELAAKEQQLADLHGQKLSCESELDQQRIKAAELETRLLRIQQDADCKVTYFG